MAPPYISTPWPKRVSKLPKHIRDGIHNMTGAKLITAGVKKISSGSLAAGDYSHLGLTFSSGSFKLVSPVTPPDNIGKLSYANIHGYSKRRNDLPKIIKSFTLTGKDWKGNDIESEYEREVYEVHNYPPLGLEIYVKLIHTETTNSGEDYYIRFDVSRSLDKNDVDFDRQLKENLGFLRENTGLISIYPDVITDLQISNLSFANWEILPPGVSLSQLVTRAVGNSPMSTSDRKELESRLKLLHQMQPGGGFVAGTKGLAGYIAARFGSGLTVLENRKLGNAIYAIYRNWTQFSTMSRTEIINSGRNSDFDRIRHTGDWVDRIQKLIEEKRTDL